MSRKLLHTAYILLAALAAAGYLHAQEKKEDEKVRLISARSAQLIEENGQSYRKVIGPARFLHNGTYLLCDTALWNVNTNIIDAMGNVRIIQERTQLSSETLQYVVDENMARFRGSLVQLQDKDSNVLRTRYLDYNTKDSVAVFQNGGAMRDKDGQIMESLYGTYDSKANLFVFNDQVNMYLDTTFVKTSRLEYRSDLSTAYFGFATDMWQDDKMLSANDGWYDRRRELFFFRRNVHLLTKDQESWSDSLYYYRTRNDVDMLGHVELMDTTRNVFALAGKFQYTDTLSQVRMTREPAIMSVTEEKGKRDTLYMGGDVLLLRGIRKCDIPEAWIKDAEKRLGDIAGDPVMEYRKKAAEAAAKAAEEAAKNDPNRPPQPPVQGKKAGKAGDKPVAPPTEKAVRPQQEPQVRPEPDSLVKPQADSLIKQLADGRSGRYHSRSDDSRRYHGGTGPARRYHRCAASARRHPGRACAAGQPGPAQRHHQSEFHLGLPPRPHVPPGHADGRRLPHVHGPGFAGTTVSEPDFLQRGKSAICGRQHLHGHQKPADGKGAPAVQRLHHHPGGPAQLRPNPRNGNGGLL